MAIRRKEMTMLTESITASAIASRVGPVPLAALDQFGTVTGYAGLIATEFSYRKDEEIYGEDEPAEYIYQIIRGAVRTYKLLSDGRRQIGTFHLPGDVFGLESGTSHRLAAEAIIDTTVRLVKRSSLEVAGMMALPMCRRDIGDYLGLTLETVSRALSQLHSEGVLGFSGARQIVLRNRARL